jgi:hypothetical protein
MRVILKPAGIVIVLVVFIGLVFAVLAMKRSRGGSGLSAGSSADLEVLQNTGFEGEYLTVVPYDNKAVLSGAIASGWQDDSSWARVTVDYSAETNNPHSGTSSQKLEIRSIIRGQSDNERDVVQFNQPLKLTQGKTYRAALWVRASEETDVELSLRQKEFPYKYAAAKVEHVGRDWKEISVTGPSSVVGDTYVMLKVWKVGTLWVDDASLTSQ